MSCPLERGEGPWGVAEHGVVMRLRVAGGCGMLGA